MRRVRFLFGGSETPRFLSGWGLALAVLVGLGLVCPSPCFADPIDLGQAGSLTIFGFNGSTVSFTNPQTLVSGPAGTTPNVGIGPNSSLNASDGTITGTLFVDPTATHIAQGNLNVLGGVVTKDLSGAVSDLTTLSATSAALTPTQTFGSITGPTSITGNGGKNVINVSSITLNGSDSLTLSGTSHDTFIVNVSGTLALTGTSSIKLNGVAPNNVLFNITGSGQQVAFTGKSMGNGLFLAPDRPVAVTGAFITGGIFAGGNISIVSGAKITSGVPEPSTLALAALGGVFCMGAVGRRWLKKTSFPCGLFNFLAI